MEGIVPPHRMPLGIDPVNHLSIGPLPRLSHTLTVKLPGTGQIGGEVVLLEVGQDVGHAPEDSAEGAQGASLLLTKLNPVPPVPITMTKEASGPGTGLPAQRATRSPPTCGLSHTVLRRAVLGLYPTNQMGSRRWLAHFRNGNVNTNV